MSNEIQTTEAPRPIDAFRDMLGKEKTKFLKVLPAHVPFEKFQSVVITAIIQNPELLTANRHSLLQSCIKSATDGLLPDGRDAALVIFNSKEKIKDESGKEREQWIKRVQYLPMYMGIQKRVRQSGEVSSINTQVAYEKDVFKWNPATLEITHEIYEGEGDRGKVRAAYCVVVMKDGGVQKEVMFRNDIEAIRKRSKAGSDDKGEPKGIWRSDYAEMSRKTVFRRAAKWLPQSVDKEGNVIRLFDEDESMGLLPDYSASDATLENPNGAGAIEDSSGDKTTAEENKAAQPDLKGQIKDKKDGKKAADKAPESKPEKMTIDDAVKIMGAVSWEKSDFPADEGKLILTNDEGGTMKLSESELFERAAEEQIRLQKIEDNAKVEQGKLV